MPCSDHNKVVYGIKELPVVSTITPSDSFVIETLAGTSIIKYSDVVFDLKHTTFESSFNKHTTDIIQLSSNIDIVEPITNNTANRIDSLTSRINSLSLKARSVITGDIQGGDTSAIIGYDFSYAPSIININFGRATGIYSEPTNFASVVQHIVPIADCLDTSLYNVEDVTGVWIELNVFVENQTEPIRGGYSLVRINDIFLSIVSSTQNTTNDVLILENSADRYKLEFFVPITKGVMDLNIFKQRGNGPVPLAGSLQTYNPDYDLNEEDIFITGFQILSRSIV